MLDDKKEAGASAKKDESENKDTSEKSVTGKPAGNVKREDVIYKLRDINANMVDAWKEIFGSNEKFEVLYLPDLFQQI